jgi:hypothetical protein
MALISRLGSGFSRASAGPWGRSGAGTAAAMGGLDSVQGDFFLHTGSNPLAELLPSK